MPKIKTYLETIKYLKPIQIYARLWGKLKSKKKPKLQPAPAHREIDIMIPLLDLDEAYCGRFAVELCREGKVRLLNQVFDLDYSRGAKRSMSPLCWFNLQYFEYAVALGAAYRKTGDKGYAAAFEKAYLDFLAADMPYTPYVLALHIPNLLIALRLFGDGLSEELHRRVDQELFRQYRYLQKHQEKHLLGNHYFEDLKALVLASYYFREDRACKKYCQKLRQQAEEQILPDGMHFELSPMYHKLILEDLLRIGKLNIPAIQEWLPPLLQRMIDALHLLEGESARTPLFNDAGDNVAKRGEQLAAAALADYGILPQAKNSLASAGYFRMDSGNLSLLCDGGIIAPDYMPGHGHNDCLSFELAVAGVPLFVNSGTYQYQGAKRKHFRSTSAHNTIVMDNHEQSQCWGEHRVAKRISRVTAELKGQQFCGAYYNYCGQQHQRSISLAGSKVTVLDQTKNAAAVQSFLHLAPGCRVDDDLQLTTENGLRGTIKPIGCQAIVHRQGELCQYAPEFGKMIDTPCIEFRWSADDQAHGYEITII